MIIEQPNETEHAEQKAPQPELELPKRESSQEQSAPAISFKVTQTGLFKRRQWKVSILPELVEFTTLDDFGVVDNEEHIMIMKEEATNRLDFASAFLSGYDVKFKQAGKEYRFEAWSKDLNKLRSWMTISSDEQRAKDEQEVVRRCALAGGVTFMVMFGTYLNKSIGVVPGGFIGGAIGGGLGAVVGKIINSLRRK